LSVEESDIFATFLLAGLASSGTVFALEKLECDARHILQLLPMKYFGLVPSCPRSVLLVIPGWLPETVYDAGFVGIRC
jgi:hypothetical protein